MQPSQNLSYGEHADQRIEFYAANSHHAAGTVVLVHGGYWRQRITAEVMRPMAQALVSAGWNVANIEYRRGPEHPWPLPTQDVAQAIKLLQTPQVGLHAPFILLGHSVGGQLVLLNSTSADAIVVLAPVTDIAKVHHDKLGDDAATEYFGLALEQTPEIYALASPLQQPRPRVPLLLIHGHNDDRVPLEHSRDYLKTMSDHSQVEAEFYQELDHFKVIDPTEAHWPRILHWLDSHRTVGGSRQ